MSLSIANNVGSLNARNNLARSTNSLNKSIERLSSGFKVNRGADGPAALVISEKQRGQIAGLKTAISNTEKAASVIQTAEGALNEVNSILNKVRALALDSANGGVNDTDAFQANQAEIQNALETIDRISANTQYGEKSLLDGSAGTSGTATHVNASFLKASADTKAGTYAVAVSTVAERATIVAGTAQTGATTADETLRINGVDIEIAAGTDAAGVVARINEFSDETGVVATNSNPGTAATRLSTREFGSAATIDIQSSLLAAVDTSGFANTVASDAGVDIVGTIDGNAATGVGNVLTSGAGNSSGVAVQIAAASAFESATGALGSVSVTNNSLVFQVGANQHQTASVSINSADSKSLGVAVSGNQFANLSSIEVTSASKSQDALAVIDAAIDEISKMRGDLGAFQSNTLDSIGNNLRTTLENTVNAESVIRDTDFAEEISKFTNQQILVQAGTSVLSNANETTQGILSLLQ